MHVLHGSLYSGAVSATRASMDHLLGREGSGRALCLVVGGAPESLDCHPGQVLLHLEKRKGFAKMALRHGAALVPMFGFGENDVYDQVANPKGSLVRRVQDALQHMFGLAPCIFMGRGVFQYSFGIVPYRKPIFVRLILLAILEPFQANDLVFQTCSESAPLY
ncbi:hypothetical protein HAZT_HAZT000709 [Hyalella azteca]|uniref:Uncharacterized protein n=1 Tax=Hyalella azteca TaxID=294128 RepID=A0A6A0H2E6_HYAAZ|nr:hypothetical protein HAZT_HAZT000709 [Hyalella azteca]